MTRSHPTLPETIARLANAERLEEQESKAVFQMIMSGEATDAQIGAILMGLRIRGETVGEITGAARVMREHALALNAPEGAIDTCGTGGDGAGTFNISTASGLLTAACGVPVAKHGNRAVSSKSGSADVLLALGINLEADIDTLEECLRETNFVFMMAPKHHSAMRHVMPARKQLATRTIFNLLGPLANPAGTKRQVMGVFARHWIKPLAEVLGRLGAERAWVVHGSDGLDELTTTGTTYVAEYHKGEVSTFEVSPKDVGLSYARREDLLGGDAHENAVTLRKLFEGNASPLADIVALNTAAALVVADKAESLQAGIKTAQNALTSGKALETLDKVIQITGRKTHGL